MKEELESQSHRNYELLSNGACTYLAWRPSGEHDYFTTVLDGQLNRKEKDCNGTDIVCRHISGFVYDNDLLNGEGDSNIDKFNSLGSELKHNPYFKYNHYDSKWPGFSYSAVVNNNKIGELLCQLASRDNFSSQKVCIQTSSHVMVIHINKNTDGSIRIRLYEPNLTITYANFLFNNQHDLESFSLDKAINFLSFQQSTLSDFNKFQSLLVGSTDMLFDPHPQVDRKKAREVREAIALFLGAGEVPVQLLHDTILLPYPTMFSILLSDLGFSPDSMVYPFSTIIEVAALGDKSTDALCMVFDIFITNRSMLVAQEFINQLEYSVLANKKNSYIICTLIKTLGNSNDEKISLENQLSLLRHMIDQVKKSHKEICGDGEILYAIATTFMGINLIQGTERPFEYWDDSAINLLARSLFMRSDGDFSMIISELVSRGYANTRSTYDYIVMLMDPQRNPAAKSVADADALYYLADEIEIDLAKEADQRASEEIILSTLFPHKKGQPHARRQAVKDSGIRLTGT